MDGWLDLASHVATNLRNVGGLATVGSHMDSDNVNVSDHTERPATETLPSYPIKTLHPVYSDPFDIACALCNKLVTPYIASNNS